MRMILVVVGFIAMVSAATAQQPHEHYDPLVKPVVIAQSRTQLLDALRELKTLSAVGYINVNDRVVALRSTDLAPRPRHEDHALHARIVRSDTDCRVEFYEYLDGRPIRRVVETVAIQCAE